jgi:hypothetical protein
MHNDDNDRRRLYSAVGTALALLDDERILELIGRGDATGWWGTHWTIEVAGSKTFVKRIPVTDVEHENPYSTRNLYDLPLYYNYGAGSVGFGAWRELATHVKTTNWVLEGAIETFPLMYHHRILPRVPTPDTIDETKYAEYVAHWNGSEAVGRYATDRANARHELVIFLEHIPNEMGTWLGANQHATQQVLRDLQDTITFLRRHGIVHFDAHFGNVVTDGNRAYLTDFGLVLDDAFQLVDDDRAFLQRHNRYDYGVALMSLGYVIFYAYMSMPPLKRNALHARLSVPEGESPQRVVQRIVANLEDVAAHGAMELDASFIAAIHQYRDVMAYMSNFLNAQRANARKDTPYDDEHLGLLLKASGVSTET